ncbi:MAG TPA: tRNA epoxyqueuosine(34) reductase QueG [Fimbriiglobus sp.]|nr:tRNA epoxyqueuosine(34) reductase QueG [Fimbriiglobus sp.]
MTDLESRLKAEAHRLGFSLTGIAPATEADGFARFEAWLDAGYAGEMAYLHQYRAERRHPRSVVEEVRSVLMLGMEHGGGARGKGQGAREERASSLAPCPLPLAPGRVAAYAHGPDYHRFVWDRENELADWLMREVPGCVALGVTDTAPLLERDFARRAGLGWVGKNTMLINTERGSFFFLGALLTDLELRSDPPHEASHCGTCTACLDACPTGAFPESGVLDARRCVSYLTIELRSPIPAELREGVGDWLFGCDVCQDVCPWNRHAAAGPIAFPSDPSLATLDPVELLSLSDAEFRQRFRGTSFFRARRSGLLRNAAVVLGNVGDERALPTLEKAAHDDDEVIRDAARWAIDKIRQRTPRV